MPLLCCRSAWSAQAHLEHHLAGSSRWHNIDLVRHRDPGAPGGWAYQAHLLCLVEGYVCDTTRQRREQTPAATAGRRGGCDVNVSNVTIASHVDGADLRITTIQRTADEQEREQRRRAKQRRRHKALDRSRRNTNPDAYHPSARQEQAAKRRADAALPPKQHAPAGPRKPGVTVARSGPTGTTGCRVPTVAGGVGPPATPAPRRSHGATPPDASPARWSPTAALPVRPPSPQTLSERTHRCTTCGLAGARDAVSAVLASCVDMGEPDDPATARVDYRLTRRLLADSRTWWALEQTLGACKSARGRQPTPPTPTQRRGEATRPPATAGSAPQTERSRPQPPMSHHTVTTRERSRRRTRMPHPTAQPCTPDCGTS
jgi:hypothetical protein